MRLTKLLIANRGEIAIRIARAASGLGLRAVAAYSEDDAESLHIRTADEATPLRGTGPSAYLDIDQVIAAARTAGCDAIHPGYGFLSENAEFARRCSTADLAFVGPHADILELFGDKAKARALARTLGVPLLDGTAGPTTLEEARAFLASLGDGGAMMVKAVCGGGGRGIRLVSRPEDVEGAFSRCQSESLAAFGRGDVYVERAIRRARHIEVQIVGDGTGAVSHLWERDCTLQRRNQKLIEIAPAPALSTALHERLIAAAVELARAVRYGSLGTFEFLVDTEARDEARSFTFLETNPRLQVEHTITEEITGIDLVSTQLRLAAGGTLKELGLLQSEIPRPRGCAVQARVNLEVMTADASTMPSGGLISAFEPPTGPGVRVDTFGYGGYRTRPNFDSLLAKVIAHVPGADVSSAVARLRRALEEFRIEGVTTNAAFLLNLLGRPEVAAWAVHTRFVEDHASELVSDIGQTETVDVAAQLTGATAARSPMIGTLVAIEVEPGTTVHQGQQIAVIEAMKMEHVVRAPVSGIVREVAARHGSTVYPGDPLVLIEPGEVEAATSTVHTAVDPERIRPDLAELIERRRALSDEARQDAVARRRKTGQRTARENIASLFDGGDYMEYGEFAVAAQRSRHTPEELQAISPADGLIAGIGRVNGDLFAEERSRCLALAYDYTVFAGTQGFFNHAKTDRMIGLAQRWRLPVVLFAEGGGGRPGETDWIGVSGISGLNVTTFARYAGLSGLVPMIGIGSGRCFAGNAALLGCSDVIIATQNANIGMGGPAMIEGAGLGVFRPEDIGPVSVQASNGVIDLLVADEPEAIHAARKYLSFFQGRIDTCDCADQRLLRELVPERRTQVYDMRAVIATLADTASVLELRRDFGLGIITSLVRIEGRAFGVLANNPAHLGGAIDAEAADKAARFMQLCDAFDLPMLSLCDTPGFMVGPDAEKSAQVRRFARMFVTAANLTVPFFAIASRKAYGLGAQAMTAGGCREPFFTVAWPTGEFGPMGLEGGVRLGFRKEMQAIEDPAQRKAFFEQKVAEAYATGKAMNVASYLEIDSVIDPRDSRAWILRGLRSTPSAESRSTKKRPGIDPW